MVLCCVDDLMFSSKIVAAARGTGTALQFVRRPDEVLARVRELQPSLVILDLDAGRLRPVETIAAIKADPALAGIPTLAYVSHVRTDLITAARAAGADEVLARSAFTGRLGELLAGRA